MRKTYFFLFLIFISSLFSNDNDNSKYCIFNNNFETAKRIIKLYDFPFNVSLKYAQFKEHYLEINKYIEFDFVKFEKNNPYSDSFFFEDDIKRWNSDADLQNQYTLSEYQTKKENDYWELRLNFKREFSSNLLICSSRLYNYFRDHPEIIKKIKSNKSEKSKFFLCLFANYEKLDYEFKEYFRFFALYQLYPKIVNISYIDYNAKLYGVSHGILEGLWPSFTHDFQHNPFSPYFYKTENTSAIQISFGYKLNKLMNPKDIFNYKSSIFYGSSAFVLTFSPKWNIYDLFSINMGYLICSNSHRFRLLLESEVGLKFYSDDLNEKPLYNGEKLVYAHRLDKDEANGIYAPRQYVPFDFSVCLEINLIKDKFVTLKFGVWRFIADPGRWYYKSDVDDWYKNDGEKPGKVTGNDLPKSPVINDWIPYYGIGFRF